MDWDVFICHADEDKEEFVRPLANELRAQGLKVWYDEFTLEPADSIRRSIEKGLKNSRFGIVVLSKTFFRKHWNQLELDALFQREAKEHKIILPIWHGVSLEDVQNYSLPLADRIAPNSSEGVARVVEKLLAIIKPDFLTSWENIRGFLRDPKSLCNDDLENTFSFKLEDLPYPFITKTSMNVLFLSGPTRYDLSKAKETGRFREVGVADGKVISSFLDLGLLSVISPVNSAYNFKIPWEIKLGDSALNLSLGSEILSTLSFLAGKNGLEIKREAKRLLIPYLEVNNSILAANNIICMPCGDVNLLLPIALMNFEIESRVRCPVHHEPYHTSESIFSEVSKNSYNKDLEAGYILLLPNPWNKEKALLICAGNSGVGTQAALLRVNLAIMGIRPFEKNPFNLPYKIVRPTYNQTTKLVTEVEDLE